MGTLFEKNIDPTVPTASILENIDPEAVKQQPNQLLNWAMFIIFQELCYITKGYSICSRCFPKISTSEGCFPAGFAPAAQRPAPARRRSRSRRNGPKMGRWGSRRQDPWKRLKNCVWFYGISWDFMRFHGLFEAIICWFWWIFMGFSIMIWILGDEHQKTALEGCEQKDTRALSHSHINGG